MTTNATDATDYYTNLSNSETVTLEIDRISGKSPVSIAGALQRGLTLPESQASGVQIGGQGRVWNLPDETLQSQGTGVEARPGDRIIQSDGTAWKIVDAANLSFNTRWRCITQKERSNNED